MKIEDLLTSMTAPQSGQLSNLNLLLNSLQSWERLYGQNFKVNSGFRSWEDQKRIYRAMNDLRLIQGKSELPIPIKSQHMSGNAVDLDDPEGKLKNWVMEHLPFFDDEGLYFEDFNYTKGWVHVQRVPPQSKKMFFLPY